MKRRVLWVLYPNIMSNEEGEIILGKRSEEIERRRSKNHRRNIYCRSNGPVFTTLKEVDFSGKRKEEKWKALFFRLTATARNGVSGLAGKMNCRKNDAKLAMSTRNMDENQLRYWWCV